MAYPRIATGKIVLPYTVSGFLHRVHAFVRNPQAVGATWNINSRATDSNDTDWKNAAEGYWLSFSYLLPAAIAAPTAEFWTKVGAIWILQDTVLCTGTNGAGSSILTEELTATFRCVNGKFLQVDVLEGNSDVPLTSRSLSAIGGTYQNGLKQWTSGHTVTDAPYGWAVNQDTSYLATASFVKLTTSFNRHLRKKRGLA